MTLWVLLRPFAYLSIRQDDAIHVWVNRGAPACAALLTGLCWLFPVAIDYIGYIKPHPVNVWGGGGLIDKIQGFVQSLPGFYTAALAVVATFNTPEMQKIMPGRPPTMKFLVEGRMTGELQLNRRLFLSAMFAYLTALSFLLTIIGAVGTTIAPAIQASLIPAAIPWFSAATASLYVFFFVQLLTVTGWGLYYLGERMHLNDGPSESDG